MSDNLVAEHRRFVERLGDSIGFGVDWRDGGGLDDVDIVWSCGLPLSLRPDEWTPLVAPVMSSARYQSRPVYFTDLVVATDHPARSFEELAGVALVMNEPASHSGYASVMFELRRRELGLDFFGSHRFSGAHLRSLEAVLGGSREVAALDSVMFDSIRSGSQELEQAARVVASIGPWPTPPLAVRTAVGAPLRNSIAQTALGLDLEVPGCERLVAVNAAAYRPLAANWAACCGS